MKPEMLPQVESLRRAVAYGMQHGKTNMIADLAVLEALFLELDWLRMRKEDLELTLGRAPVPPAP